MEEYDEEIGKQCMKYLMISRMARKAPTSNCLSIAELAALAASSVKDFVDSIAATSPGNAGKPNVG
jgi:hypothetical protein